MASLPKAGDVILDHDGTVFATVAKDVALGDPITVSTFIWHKAAPKAGDVIPRLIAEWANAGGHRFASA